MDKKISIIGIGRLGLCMALCLEKCGFEIVGVDISDQYVQSINSKTLQSAEPNVENFLKNSKNLLATTNLDIALQHSDLLFIFVATPYGPKAYDHSHLSSLLMSINKRKIHNKHIVIGCTVLPGYINNIGTSLVSNCTNTTLSYNPEFIAQGNIINGLLHPDMVLIGQANNNIGNKLENIYKILSPTAKICRMSVASAEITKLAVNCAVTTKIAFANMIADIADTTPTADKHDILDAIGSDTRIGPKYLKPGYGYGGPCFPRDNRALGYYAEQIGIKPLIPIATDQANKLHAEFQTIQFLKQPGTIVFENVCYKDNCLVPIIEESQKLAIAEKLAKLGRQVEIYDSETIINEVRKEYGNLFKYNIK